MSGPFFYKDCTHDCTSSQQRAADLRPAPAYRLHCRRRPQRPFRIRDRVIGLLYLDHRFKTGVFSERELELHRRR